MNFSQRTRIVEIEFLRVIAALVIMLYHLGVLQGGMLAVEIFAVLSGILMARSVEKSSLRNDVEPQRKSFFAFIGRKIKSFYPELIVSSILGLLCFNYISHSAEEIREFVMGTVVGNFLLLKMSGIVSPASGACPPVWYLSSMVLSMSLIYQCARICKNSFVFFGCGWLLFLYLYSKMHGVEMNHYSEFVGFTYGGNLRVCSEMMIAIGVYPLINKLQVIMQKSVSICYIVRICKYCALFVILTLFCFENGKTDILFLLMTLVYMIGAFSCAAIQTVKIPLMFERISRCFAAVSLGVFLTHFPALRMAGWIYIRFSLLAWQHVLMTIVLTVLFSVITYFVGKMIRCRLGW